jgi:uncharacterized membrane protein (Fun14 family)
MSSLLLRFSTRSYRLRLPRALSLALRPRAPARLLALPFAAAGALGDGPTVAAGPPAGASSAAAAAAAPRAADAPAADCSDADLQDTLVDRFLMSLPQVGFGSVLGFASGYAIKKLGKIALMGVGAAFLLVQGLAYAGWVEVNWSKARADAERAVDVDGDGKVTSADIKIWWRK